VRDAIFASALTGASEILGQIQDLRTTCTLLGLKKKKRFYGVMVSTLDSESSDPSSNLGRTCIFNPSSLTRPPRV
jgi:predicted secreted protein